MLHARQPHGHPAGQQLDDDGLDLRDLGRRGHQAVLAAVAVDGADDGPLRVENRRDDHDLDADEAADVVQLQLGRVLPEGALLLEHPAEDVLARLPVPGCLGLLLEVARYQIGRVLRGS